VPTPRAMAIASVITQLLELRKDLSDGGRNFSPALLEREFIIAGSDIAQLSVLMALYGATRDEAPHVRFRAITLGRDDMVSALETGHVDLAMGSYPSLVSGINAQLLYNEHYLCFGLPSHPFISSGSLNAFMRSDHVVVTTRGMAHAHRAAERSLTDLLPHDNIRIIASSFLVALAACAEMNLILTAPARVIGCQAKTFGLACVTAPIPMDPFEVKQYWHARNHDDPAHRWLRQRLHKSLASRFRD
jgi:DNA-binding transcriptional LysR family regulator